MIDFEEFLAQSKQSLRHGARVDTDGLRIELPATVYSGQLLVADAVLCCRWGDDGLPAWAPLLRPTAIHDHDFGEKLARQRAYRRRAADSYSSVRVRLRVGNDWLDAAFELLPPFTSTESEHLLERVSELDARAASVPRDHDATPQKLAA